MHEYIRYFRSDLYKLRHSWFFPVHFIFPVCGAVLMLLYAKISNSKDLNKLAAFLQIIALAYPFVVSVVCQMTAEQEKHAGHSQNMLTLPSRGKAIFSKFTVLISSGLLSTALSTVLFGNLFPLLTGARLPSEFFITVPAVLWGSNLLLYGLHLILAFRFGPNLGISVGVVGSLLSALLQTGLGTGVWYLIPYGLGIRFAESTLTKMFQLPAGSSFELHIGIIFCISATCVMIGIMMLWFFRYSGTSTD